MIVSDRLLVALARYLVDEVGLEFEPRLRDWSGTKSERELVLDADEPEEHETMRGCFAVDGVLVLSVHPRDLEDADRREVLGQMNEALADSVAVMEWLNDSEGARGLGGHGLHVFDLRTDDGVWEEDGERRIHGKVEFAAMVCGEDKS